MESPIRLWEVGDGYKWNEQTNSQRRPHWVDADTRLFLRFVVWWSSKGLTPNPHIRTNDCACRLKYFEIFVVVSEWMHSQEVAIYSSSDKLFICLCFVLFQALIYEVRLTNKSEPHEIFNRITQHMVLIWFTIGKHFVIIGTLKGGRRGPWPFLPADIAWEAEYTLDRLPEYLTRCCHKSPF